MKKWILVLGIIFVTVFFRFLLGPVIEQLELITYDIRAKLAVDGGPFGSEFHPADKKIILLAIDDKSRKELTKHPDINPGPWPWRRDIWADVTDFIEKGNPKVIVYDIIFNDTTDSVPYDREFGLALRKYDNVVLATTLNDHFKDVEAAKQRNSYDVANSVYNPINKSLNVKILDKDIERNITYYSHAPVADRFTMHNMMGVTNKVAEKGSTIRSIRPIFKLIKNNETYYMPSLAFAGFLKAVGNQEEIFIKNNEILYKGRQIPVDDYGATNISWHGWGNNYYPMPIYKVLLSMHGKGTITPDFFKDKIVVIGRTEAGTDIHQSAVNQSYAGPEVVATSIDNFLNDTDVTNPKARKILTNLPIWLEYIFIVIFCCLLVILGAKSKSAYVGLINSVLILFVYVLAAAWAFIDPDIRIWVPIVAPVYYMIVASVVVYTFRLHEESAKKTEIMNMFGKFVSPSVLNQLVKNPEGVVLRNTKKRITVMFCDVKDFTSISEKSNPEQLVDNLNELFNEIVGIIFQNNGTVDKFVGDCVMAYWGDPIASEDDPYMAVKTALEIKKKVQDMKISSIREGKLVFDVKIGINTGDALLGLTGSEKIMNYTAMGDAVNTAARLESSCSKLSKDILITKATYEEIKDKIVAFEAGTISVKGKDEQIEIYEPIGFVK